jgi:hypothetical protein
LYNLWEEVVNIASSLDLSQEEDELVWQFNSSGVYSSQSLYAVINFRGVTPIYIPAVWSLVIPPRVHFLCLLSKNKLLTRDNLGKRKRVDDKTCLFCNELETIHHLFYDCVVAKRVWDAISEVVGFQIGLNFESMARCQLCNKKYGVVNMITSAACWSLWKVRNAICFQGDAWLGMKAIWCRLIPMMRCWSH